DCAALKQVDCALLLSGLELHITVLQQFNGVVAEGTVGIIGGGVSKRPRAEMNFAVLGMHLGGLLAFNRIGEIACAERTPNVVAVMAMRQCAGVRRDFNPKDAKVNVGEDEVVRGLAIEGNSFLNAMGVE